MFKYNNLFIAYVKVIVTSNG